MLGYRLVRAPLKVREAIPLADRIKVEASSPDVQEDLKQVIALLKDAVPFIEAAAGMTREEFARDYFAGCLKEDVAAEADDAA